MQIRYMEYTLINRLPPGYDTWLDLFEILKTENKMYKKIRVRHVYEPGKYIDYLIDRDYLKARVLDEIIK